MPTPPSRSPRTTVADDGTWLEVTDLGTGPAVLLVHAGSMAAHAWDRQVRVLLGAGHRVITYDCRGHGASSKPYGDYGLDRLVADARTVLDDAGVADASVVGWSLGGMTALRLAATHPERVRRLVLVATNGVSASRTEAFPYGTPGELTRPHVLEGLRQDRPAYLKQGLGELFAEEPDPETLGWLQRIALQCPSWAQLACMQTFLDTDQSHLLEQVTAPTALIVGTLDNTLDLDGVDAVRERLRGELIELECGALPMFEVPDAFEAALLSVLTAAPDRGAQAVS